MENEIKLFLQSNSSLQNFCKANKLDKQNLIKNLKKQGFPITGKPGKDFKKIKEAVEYYLNNNYCMRSVLAITNCKLTAPVFKKVLISLDLYDKSKSRRVNSVKGYEKPKPYNEHVFDFIDSEEKAYWLGFIFADGYIYSAPLKEGKTRVDYNFELCSSDKDKGHMEKFNKFIDRNKEVKVTKSDKLGHFRCRVCLSSKHLWNTLNYLGCTPNKSLTLSFPKLSVFRDASLIRHFIRGYFDGDGCITCSNMQHTSCEVLLLGTFDFLNAVLHFSGLEASIEHNHGNLNETTAQFKTTGSKAIRFLHYLYKDCRIYLNRKYEKYLEFCRLYGEPCR